MKAWEREWIRRQGTELHWLTEMKHDMLVDLNSKGFLDDADIDELSRTRHYDEHGVSVEKRKFFKKLAGQDCYDILIQALRDSCQSGAADLLEAGKKESSKIEMELKQKGKVEETVAIPKKQEESTNRQAPEGAPSHEEENTYCHRDSLIEEFDFFKKPDPLVVNVRSALGHNLRQGGYPLTQGGKRYVLLLNVMRFGKLSNRKGAEVDTINMKKLWEGLGWEVVPFEGTDGGSIPQQTLVKPEHRETFPQGTKGWITKTDLMTAISCFRGEVERNNAEAIVVVVSSHGVHDGIVTSDGEFVHFQQEIVDQFDHTKCPKLENKPKIFIQNSCAGYRNQQIMVTPPSRGFLNWLAGFFSGPARDTATQAFEVASDNLEKCPTRVVPNTSAQTDAIRRAPNNDVMLIRAQIPGWSAWRDPRKGSFFAVVFTHILMNMACTTDFYAMMKIIQTEVAFINANYPAEDKSPAQVPVLEDTNFKKFYLIPTQTP